MRQQISDNKQVHSQKYYDLKQKYRVLHDSFVKVDEQRNEFKDVLVEQKKSIKTLKKKLKYYKDRLKQYCDIDNSHTVRALSPESHTKRNAKNS